MKLSQVWVGCFAAAAFTAIAYAQTSAPSTAPASQAQAQNVLPGDTASAASQPAEGKIARGYDSRLAKAEAYVAKSDKYMHHSKLKRGMKGYGLTVMAGTQIVRFDAEIVSVMTNWGPHQDVVLAQLKGLNLEKSGIIAGMSGSPVYMKDPADGKDKLIGAVAYGWSAPKEPLCGIQPISQMLAISGVLDDAPAPTVAPSGSAALVAAAPADAVAASAGGAYVSAVDQTAYLEAVLNPAKINFGPLCAGTIGKDSDRSGAPRLAPLKTPLMISGINGSSLSMVEGALQSSGMTLVQSGGVGAGGTTEAAAKLEPGSGIAVPLVCGDADMSAVGTVTEVIGDKVMAFGHAFFSEGDTEFPMGPAYVHTIVSGVVESFKLASPVSITGSLKQDSNVGIAGVVGPKVSMIPMTVTVDWKGHNQKQTFNYRIVRHRKYTPLLTATLVDQALASWQNLPNNHTIRYGVNIDFGSLGKYNAKNISTNAQTMELVSDLMRPVAGVLLNPWKAPPQINRIDITVNVEDGTCLAQIVDMKLDGRLYRPGETITGSVSVMPYRKGKQELPIEFELPKDIAQGQYSLTVCDSHDTTASMKMEMPQRFDPQSLEELFQAVQMVVQPKGDKMYLRLPLRDNGLAIKQTELPGLPASKAMILAQGDKAQIRPYVTTLVKGIDSKYVFNGNATVNFTVTETPRQILTRDQRKPQ